MKYWIILTLTTVAILTGCTIKDVNMTNAISDFDIARTGDETGTTTTIENDLRLMDQEGARILTPEERKRVKKAFNEGLEAVKNANIGDLQAYFSRGNLLHYVAAGKRDWKGWKNADITLSEFVDQNPKSKTATEDVQFLLWQMFKIHPTFVLTECKRSAKRQKKLVAKGRSWTKNSKHLSTPFAEACDIVSVRKTGRKDFKDIDALGLYQGLAVGLGEILSTMPCEIFRSKVTRAIDWTVRDLYHIEAVRRKECKGKEKLTDATLIYRFHVYAKADHRDWKEIWNVDGYQAVWVLHIPIRTEIATVPLQMPMWQRGRYRWGLSDKGPERSERGSEKLWLLAEIPRPEYTFRNPIWKTYSQIRRETIYHEDWYSKKAFYL